MDLFVITSICKGGGYMYCRTEPKHPKANSNGLYPLHRVLAENKIGRLLGPGEDVHHRDEDKSNNDPSNLEVLTKPDHARLHAPEKDLVLVNCPVCNKEIRIKPGVLRRRTLKAKLGPITCSYRCSSLRQVERYQNSIAG